MRSRSGPLILAPIFMDLRGRAGAGLVRGAVVAAGAGVHARAEHEIGGIFHRAAHAGDRDDAVFEGLSERFQRRTVVFGHLVEKQDAVVREADLPWFDETVATAAYGNGTGGMVRRAERTLRNHARPCKRPATECILVTSSASSKVMSGMMVGRQRASMVLPVPGGPMSRMLCEPATAISTARFAAG